MQVPGVERHFPGHPRGKWGDRSAPHVHHSVANSQQL